MSVPVPNSGRPQGLPIDVSSLEIEMNRSKLIPATLPMSVYDAMVNVNGLIVLESVARFQQGNRSLADHCEEQQRFYRKHIAFHPKVNEQFDINRKFWELPPLPDPK